MKHRTKKNNPSKGIAKKRKRQEKFKEFIKKDPQSIEAKYATHGQSNLNFVDTQITTVSYPWTRVTPNRLQHSTKPKTLRTLRQICAATIALQSSKITPDLLRTLPWSIWKVVWTMILGINTDSIQVYTLFLKHFGHFSDFKSHKAHIMNARDETIAFTQIPQNRLHRIETVFSNIVISDMIEEMLKLKTFVILDMSHIPKLVNYEEYFSIFNIPYLVCLDLSNHDIDDTFLQHLSSCISGGSKLTRLILIKLVNTKVTHRGLLKFLDTVSFHSCKLDYIQVDFEIKHKHWSFMGPGQSKIVQNMPMGLSMNALKRSVTISSNSSIQNVPMSKIPILDIFIANEQYNPHDLDRVWHSRNKMLKINKSRTTYVYEKTSSIDWTKIDESMDEEKPQRLKKSAIKTNAKDFFCM
ncbi:hypothetical protein CANMA_000270 [Candida margitis]|uniref:uncharacterized protein n=1 Tax=Candida margitis TaxID=1775924 RepID=UPI002225FF4C|nr:uncharacterized protein CANMA_000270 [Candida margitis]KAI5970679.1 hypothetical protein CANMA_000270 [Candida margitis]